MPITVKRTPASKAAELARDLAACIAGVNDAVGQARLPYVTSIPGQEMIYGAKEREALAYLAADPEPPDLTGFPFMAVEVGISASTPLELARLWRDTAERWRIVGPAFEEVRLGAIRDLKAASDPAALAAAMASFHSRLAEVR